MIRIVFFFLLFAAPAFAQELKIDKQTCRYLTQHHPAPDVAYQPGVDAHGNEVAPADLYPSVTIGDSFTIPLTVELGEKYGLKKAKGTQATVGVVTVDGNKAYLNGQPLGDEDEENIAVLCLEANGKHQ